MSFPPPRVEGPARGAGVDAAFSAGIVKRSVRPLVERLGVEGEAGGSAVVARVSGFALGSDLGWRVGATRVALTSGGGFAVGLLLDELALAGGGT